MQTGKKSSEFNHISTFIERDPNISADPIWPESFWQGHSMQGALSIEGERRRKKEMKRRRRRSWLRYLETTGWRWCGLILRNPFPSHSHTHTHTCAAAPSLAPWNFDSKRKLKPFKICLSGIQFH